MCGTFVRRITFRWNLLTVVNEVANSRVDFVTRAEI